MTEHIDMPYGGTCSNGPWKGQYIDSEVTTVRHKSLRGHYEYAIERGAWHWVPAITEGQG